MRRRRRKSVSNCVQHSAETSLSRRQHFWRFERATRTTIVICGPLRARAPISQAAAIHLPLTRNLSACRVLLSSSCSLSSSSSSSPVSRTCCAGRTNAERRRRADVVPAGRAIARWPSAIVKRDSPPADTCCCLIQFVVQQSATAQQTRARPV